MHGKIMPCIFDDTDIRFVFVLIKEIECGRGELTDTVTVTVTVLCFKVFLVFLPFCWAPPPGLAEELPELAKFLCSSLQSIQGMMKPDSHAVQFKALSSCTEIRS
jgi:hypothetical protein